MKKVNLNLNRKKKSEEEVEEKPTINYFSGSKDYKWLSSFNKAKPFDLKVTYPTVEHAFHAQKIEKDHPLHRSISKQNC